MTGAFELSMSVNSSEGATATVSWICTLRYFREKSNRLSQENRVLRREQTAGKRDEVILQLETELQVKEDEVRMRL